MSSTSEVVITLTGADRVGIVEEVTAALLGVNANVETSRMARLGTEFAILLLASLPAENIARIAPAFGHLTNQGYKITVTRTEPAAPKTDWLAYRIEVQGADHEGIIHDIVRGLSERGINIEEMETGTTPASTSGTLLFTMRAKVAVPPDLQETDWIADLNEAGARENVDVEVEPA